MNPDPGPDIPPILPPPKPVIALMLALIAAPAFADDLAGQRQGACPEGWHVTAGGCAPDTITDSPDPIIRGGRLRNVQVQDGPDVVFGLVTMTRSDCPATATTTIVETSAVAIADLLPGFRDCETPVLILTGDLSDSQLASLADEYAPDGACHTLYECTANITHQCGINGHGTARTAELVADPRSTLTGDACEGRCSDGTRYRIRCLKLKVKQ